jgi:hypothetical protein
LSTAASIARSPDCLTGASLASTAQASQALRRLSDEPDVAGERHEPRGPSNPKAAAGFSQQEFADEIAKGQIATG